MARSFLRLVFWTSAIGGAICLLLYLFVFDTWVVPEGDPVGVASMVPTLAPGDRILVQRGSRPRVGQLARCVNPAAPQELVVARVMGADGDTVTLDGARVLTNGKAAERRHACGAVTLPHPLTGQPVALSCSVEDNGAWTYAVLYDRDHGEGPRVARVEPGRLYLVSDNRHIHKDSRDFGDVDATTCEHVVFRLWGEKFVDASRRFSILY